MHTITCHLGQNWLDIVDGNWRLNPDLSAGDQLSDSGSHLLDVLLWITDARPGFVSVVFDECDRRVDVNSALAASLDGPHGRIVASIGITGEEHTLEERLSVWDTNGRQCSDKDEG